MRAERELLIDLMFDNRRQYQIPVYQRNYDWKKDNCLVLFNDVISAYINEKPHFLGTIVQVQKDEENGIKRFIIIDGQQRMTSVYLFLKALYDLANDEDKENLKGLIFNKSNSREFYQDERTKLKLKPITSDNIQFSLLMSDKFDEMDRSSNIYINYDYFCSLIRQSIGNNSYSIKNIKSGLEHLEIVMISLKEPDDEPQIIFERINSTGEDLKLADLIRNYLLMTDQNMEGLYNNYWLPIETLIGRDRINDYISNYLVYKLPEFKDENAYQQFKKYADSNNLSHESILTELKQYSKYYHVFIGTDQQYSTDINNLLNGYRLLKQSTIYPLFFSVFDDFDREVITQETLISVLDFFLNYTLRRIITGVPSNSLRGLYKTLYKRIFVDDGNKTNENYLNGIYKMMASIQFTKDAFPDDTSFKEKLMSENLYKNRTVCKFILSILENGYSSEKISIDKDITIEHIMPQNGDNEDWKEEIGENYDFIYTKYLHSLGNLTLTGYNSELSDKKFSEKVRMIKEKSRFSYLNEDIINKTSWSENEILARAERLSSKLINVFKQPNGFIEATSIKNSGLIKCSVCDAADMTGQRPISFIFKGEQTVVNNWSDMLTKACELLAGLDADTFRTIAKNRDIYANLPLSYDQSKFRTPREVGNTGIYVETNYNANAIVKNIAKLLDEFNVSNDDFIIYAEATRNNVL